MTHHISTDWLSPPQCRTLYYCSTTYIPTNRSMAPHNAGGYITDYKLYLHILIPIQWQATSWRMWNLFAVLVWYEIKYIISSHTGLVPHNAGRYITDGEIISPQSGSVPHNDQVYHDRPTQSHMIRCYIYAGRPSTTRCRTLIWPFLFTASWSVDSWALTKGERLFQPFAHTTSWLCFQVVLSICDYILFPSVVVNLWFYSVSKFCCQLVVIICFQVLLSMCDYTLFPSVVVNVWLYSVSKCCCQMCDYTLFTSVFVNVW